ncbi:hypothetical protein GTW09_10920 [Alteromonas hispanica]|uniref:Lipoprotein n=1 Tax=Alteromonas hispanica TaxID=315421 RepID=A0A6L9MVM2_9ALTE|nr:lipoprotein [Alteromonas hispanica]AUC86944.1 hypothetical protein CW735_01035 [Alteromonas sp. MB-3u-76]NDW22035.1 hypothetical protein [Alteromonas hispanica]
MIAAFIVFIAGFSVLNKLAVFLLTLTALSGCGYKGALYIPDAPTQNSPPPSSATQGDSEQGPNTKSTAPASISGETN